MARRRSIIYVAKDAFGAHDAFAPVMAEIFRKHGDQAMIDSIFLTQEALDRLSTSKFHMKLFETYSHVHRLVAPGGWPRWKARIYKFVLLVSLLLRRRLAYGRPIIIYNDQATSLPLFLFMKLLGLFGRRHWFSTIQSPFSDEYCDRLHNESAVRLRLLEGKTAQIPRPRDPGRGFCFLADEIPRYREVFGWSSDFQPIGFPRLFPSWQATIQELGQPVLQEELARVGLPEDTQNFVTVILTNPDYFWFEREDTLFDLVADVVAVTRKYFGDVPVFLKSKAVMTAMYEAEFAKRNLPRTYLTTCALSVLSLRSKCAIGIHESSGIFDFVVAGTPTIEYSRYSKEWIELFPNKTPWIDIPGFALAETQEQLDSFFGQIDAGTFPVTSHAELAKYLEHKLDLSPLIGGNGAVEDQPNRPT